VFLLDQAVVESLTSLFDNGEIFKANTQLALAKQKGAKGTILLLDYDLPSWYPDDARQVLANNLNSEQLFNMNAIYLVKVSQNRVSKVWGTTQNIFSIG
jgi:nitrous oxide reductase accessory protein NosL